MSTSNDRPDGWDEAVRMADLIRGYLGAKVSKVFLDITPSDRGATGILYDTFTIHLTWEQPRGNLAAGIALAGGRMMTAPFGAPFTLNGDTASVLDTLSRMDEWARLQLTDKYLERFDATYGITRHSPVDEKGTYFTQLRYRSGQRVPVQLFKVDADGPHVYDRATQGFVADTDGTLAGLQRDPLREQLWPITAEQAAETEQMLRTDQYHPLTIPGVFD